MFGVMKQLAKVVYRLVMTLEHLIRAAELTSTGKGLMAGIEIDEAKAHLAEGKKQAEHLLKTPFAQWNKD